MKTPSRLTACLLGLTLTLGRPSLSAAPPVDQKLAQQIFDTMLQVPGVAGGSRPVHAKGTVCEGTFTASTEAAGLSKAAQFQGKPVPVIVRFSDGAPDPHVPDFSPESGPRGFAIRFSPPTGGETDIVAMSHNGFVVGSGEEFLALQQAVVATDPSKPHPWPVEKFLGSHPAAMKFVQDNGVPTASYATESFFSNDSFVFVNKEGVRKTGRYKFIAAAGEQKMSTEEPKTKSPDFLAAELKARLTKAPVKLRVIVQLPNSDDSTKDPSVVWPEDRKTVDTGTITITSVVADSEAASRKLAFTPTRLAPGIELSDDPLPALRAAVYALSSKRRQQ